MRSAAIPFDFAQDDKSVVGALRMTFFGWARAWWVAPRCNGQSLPLRDG